MTVKETSATRQQQIIAAALDIIAKRGLANLTTAAIAQEVGFSEGAIFKHFSYLLFQVFYLLVFGLVIIAISALKFRKNLE